MNGLPLPAAAAGAARMAPVGLAWTFVAWNSGAAAASFCTAFSALAAGKSPAGLLGGVRLLLAALPWSVSL